MIKSKLLAAGAVLLCSAGIAAAAPAIVSNDLNMRSGPGTEYGVVATIPAGATVDVGGCTGSWCEVSFRGASGFASARYLSGGGAPSAAVVAPSYGYGPDYAYSDDYYDDGYAYGPSIGFYAGPRWRHGWPGRWHGARTGNWQGRWQGGTRTGTWQGREGRVGSVSGGGFNRGAAAGTINRGPAAGSFSRAAPGSVTPQTGAQPQTSAPVGLPSGGGAAVSPGGGARMGGGAAAGGAVQRGQGR